MALGSCLPTLVIGKSPPQWPRLRRNVGGNVKGGGRSLNMVIAMGQSLEQQRRSASLQRHRQVRAQLESLGLLTLIRSFSFCHFSASSSISMIFSCSCSFCSDSSVCRESVEVGVVRNRAGQRKQNRRPELMIHHRADSGTFPTHPCSPSLSSCHQ